MAGTDTPYRVVQTEAFVLNKVLNPEDAESKEIMCFEYKFTHFTPIANIGVSGLVNFSRENIPWSKSFVALALRGQLSHMCDLQLPRLYLN